jgi:hypothetical protein
LDEVRQRLDLSPQRLDLLRTLAAGDSLTAVATLLGMENAADSKVQDLHRGLQLLQMQVPYPEALQKQPLPLIGIDPEAIPTDDEATCRMVIQETLDHLGLPFELPFLMLCRQAEKGRHLLPGDRVALIIDEPVLRELFFAPQPSQTLAGLLLTRGLLALSPYSIQGEVKNPHMFYGRERDLREIVQAETPQFLLVGPRRIVKSSLLRRLQDELPRQQPALQVLSLDLLGTGLYRHLTGCQQTLTHVGTIALGMLLQTFPVQSGEFSPVQCVAGGRHEVFVDKGHRVQIGAAIL